MRECNMETVETNGKSQKAFTVKALIAGLIGIFLVAGASKISPTLAKQALLQHQLGIGIYFYMFLICLFWNPFCGRFLPRLALNFKELAVTMIMTLTAGGFAWVGWMKQIYTQSVILPQQYDITQSWQNYHILEFIEKKTLVNAGVVDQTKIEGFINGLSNKKGEWISFSDIPFEGWGNMVYWGLLIACIALMSLALLMIVNRQWIRNEKLSYPLATVAESLFRKSDPRNYFSDIFRNGLFWLAFAFVVFIHLFNYLSAAYPAAEMGKIPLSYSLNGLQTILPSINDTGMGGALTTVRIMFLIIGIAYFLAPALSLSVGLNAFVYLIFAAQVFSITGKAPTDVALSSCRAGAYLAFFIMLIILGRRYYGSVMLKALFIGRANDDDRGAVIGARLFIITALVSVYMFTLYGMELPVAILMTFVVIVVYLVFTRIICEAGIPMMVAPFLPVALFGRMFGGAALGPYNLMSTGSTSGVLFGDMKQLLMPYIATGLKIGDDAGVKMRRMASLAGVSIFIALAVAFSVHLWQYYSMGITDITSKDSSWRMGITEAVSEIGRLHINGQLEPYGVDSSGEAGASAVTAGPGFFERIGDFSPDSEVWIYFVFGLAAVFAVGFLRTRFLWWPFHAVIFCIWKTEPANMIWASFLMGWFFRSMIVRFGGEQNYIKLKPVFFGLIFGDIFAAGMIILYGLVYYFITGSATTIIYQV